MTFYWQQYRAVTTSGRRGQPTTVYRVRGEWNGQEYGVEADIPDFDVRKAGADASELIQGVKERLVAALTNNLKRKGCTEVIDGGPDPRGNPRFVRTTPDGGWITDDIMQEQQS